MARPGFIHDKLDIKFLILYLMARVAAPVDFVTLTDLTMCDEGVDYFQFAESVAELLETEHLSTPEDEMYVITEKGRKNGAVCESSLPYSVRLKCDRNLARLNAALRRNAQVGTEILPRTDGGFTLRLTLDDETGNLMTLEVLTASETQAGHLAERFRAHPESVYKGVLEVLLTEPEKE